MFFCIYIGICECEFILCYTNCLFCVAISMFYIKFSKMLPSDATRDTTCLLTTNGWLYYYSGIENPYKWVSSSLSHLYI